MLSRGRSHSSGLRCLSMPSCWRRIDDVSIDRIRGMEYNSLHVDQMIRTDTSESELTDEEEGEIGLTE